MPEQDIHNGDFPTVKSLNPENHEALEMAIEKAKKTGAQIVLAADPDADRIALAVRDKKGEYQLVNGNQLVVMLLNYIITRNAELGRITGDEYCVKTIVTTETIKRIADANNVKCFDCYTGFKWIADVMRNMEGKGRYIGGGEESYGFLAETFVRDKDSISANSLMAEMAAWAADKGREPLRGPDRHIRTIRLLPRTRHKHRASGQDRCRRNSSDDERIPRKPAQGTADSPIVEIKDYADLNCRNLKTGETTKMNFPATSNVLQFLTEAGDKISIRPSGDRA